MSARPTSAARQSPHGTFLAAILRRRAAQGVLVALAVSTLCFVVVQNLPGDQAYRIAAGRYGYDRVTAESAAAVRGELGLDRPAWQQLGSWLGDLVTLDLGRSVVTGAPVIEEVHYYLTGSLTLATVSLLIGIAIGGSLGGLAARRVGGVADRLTLVWVSATRALPPFLLGLLLVILLSVQLGLLPAAGHDGPSSILLPALTLGLGLSGLLARITRDTLVEITASEHVRFARTKGLPERLVWLRHVCRNAGTTLVAYLGVQAVVLIEGVVVVESLFAWQGLGHALVHAVFWRDVPVLQATALVLTLLVVAVNTVVDIATARLDPRPRLRERVAA